MSNECDVAIIGAGPYGLSLAAHLRDRKIDCQIFGEPMQFWRDHMPKGMHLKSDGFASNLYDPHNTYPLRAFCNERGLPYHDSQRPVALQTFADYGLAFQARFLPSLRRNNIVSVNQIARGFALTLDDGAQLNARRVVVATGIRSFSHLPPALQTMPPEFVTHSSEHHDLAAFKNRSVIVVGAGASATDIAALLQDNGADVQIVARRNALRFHSGGDAKPRSLYQRLRHPSSGIGPGLRTRFYCEAPGLFYHFPQELRFLIVRRTLGPAGGWFMRDKVIGKIPVLANAELEAADVRQNKAHLTIRQGDGSHSDLAADHVIAATGYKVDLRRLTFLADDVRARLTSTDGTPVLSPVMQSSVPGLYFIGAVTANCFGPVMRFAFGARYAARRVTRALAR